MAAAAGADGGGALSWSLLPIVQNFLVRQAPAGADLQVGINVAAMHVGVAGGLGRVMVARGALAHAPWLGSAMVALAFMLALAAVRGPSWRAALQGPGG
ncbi:hypothetical protein [Cupriavidus necator]|uniref:hypothetical protein n=1 Tax=Cupriavidus necator TaxID=106590 RepID=UPI001C0F5D05|nr:hypothetical protein [Cupriavidus necator]